MQTFFSKILARFSDNASLPNLIHFKLTNESTYIENLIVKIQTEHSPLQNCDRHFFFTLIRQIKTNGLFIMPSDRRIQLLALPFLERLKTLLTMFYFIVSIF